METISLKKVTALVALFTVSAFLIDAVEATEVAVKKTTVTTIEAPTITIDVAKQMNNFEQLIKQFDQDNNQLLSKKELANSNEKDLLTAFNLIDKNADAGLSSDEYQQFLAISKSK